MSDSGVNTDIGDVLSSVKRMVREDMNDDAEFLFVPPAAKRKPGRLVLTDALRVTEKPKGLETVAPLKLVPEFNVKNPVPEQAANLSEHPTGPMRLQPADQVAPAQPPSKPGNIDTMSFVPVAENKAEDEKKDLAGSLSAKIEALEAAIARTEDQWEPDGESNDAYSGTPTGAVEWPVEEVQTQPEDDQDAEEESPATFIRDTRDEQAAEAARPDDLDEPAAQALDEETLKQAVAQIVRQELQGTLGEGITRNLRKMIRREIAKAIAEQDVT